jgi:hypothetical protein
MCNAGGKCAIRCSSGCYALRVISTGKCYRGCTYSPLKISGKFIELKRDDTVTLVVKAVSLLDVGIAIGKIYPDPIAVPVGKANRKASLTIKEAPISKVIKSIGLLS